MDLNTVLDDLVFSLKSSDPYKIILFGSYARGNPSENSDIDLIEGSVVLVYTAPRCFLPENNAEFGARHFLVFLYAARPRKRLYGCTEQEILAIVFFLEWSYVVWRRLLSSFYLQSETPPLKIFPQLLRYFLRSKR